MRRFLFGLLLIIIGAAGWYAIDRIRDARAIGKLEAAIAKRGEPLTLRELARSYPPVPDEENAAVALLDVWEKEDQPYWSAFRQQKRPLPSRPEKKFDTNLPYLGEVKFTTGQQLTAASRQAINRFLSERRDHIAAVRAAVQRPHSRFPIALEDGPAVLVVPHLSAIKGEAQSLRLVALLASEQDNPGEALTALEDIVRLANEPVSFSQLVRATLLEIAISATEDLLCRRAPTAEELDRLKRMLGAIDSRSLLRTALLADRPAALSLLDMPDATIIALAQLDGDVPNPAQHVRKYRFGMGLWAMTGVLIAERRLILETTTEAVEIATNDWAKALLLGKELDDRMEKRIHTFPPKKLSSLALSPSPAKRYARIEALRRAALIAVAVEDYRSTHSGPPENLDQLTLTSAAESAKDPFTGQRMLYRVSPTNYVVYSVGSNLRDDGGSRNRSSSGYQLDITFSVTTGRR